MATRKPSQLLQSVVRRLERPVHSQKRCIHSDRPIKEHDVVLLRQRAGKRSKWRLAHNVRQGHKINLPHGAHVTGEDLIGRRFLDRLVDSGGHGVLVHEASLSSYVVNADRMATPIYPHDAGAIVSLMDLHPERPDEPELGEEQEQGQGPKVEAEAETEFQEPFEVFEAGTGMGSLTLHIARALHAGNRGMGRRMREAVAGADIKRTGGSEWTGLSTDVEDTIATGTGGTLDFSKLREQGAVESLTLGSRLDVPEEMRARLETWRTSRRYVLHTLDRNAAHAREAWKFLRGFRGGMYLPNVDVHIGSVEAYLGGRLEARGGKPFLSRAMLDMPAPQGAAVPVIKALRINGLLVVFNPSISQIADFSRWLAEDQGGRTGLRLERVVELANTTTVGADEDGGQHDAVGGKVWDVRTVVPKNEEGERAGRAHQVMRPKVGDRVAGGGFVAVYRKWSVREGSKDSEQDSEGKDADVKELDKAGGGVSKLVEAATLAML